MLCPARSYTAECGYCQVLTPFLRAKWGARPDSFRPSPNRPLPDPPGAASHRRGYRGGVLWGPPRRSRGEAPSDLRCQLGVLLFADQVVELGRVFDADAQQPSGGIRLAVHDVGVLEHFGIHLEDLPADRRLDRRRSFL